MQIFGDPNGFHAVGRVENNVTIVTVHAGGQEVRREVTSTVSDLADHTRRAAMRYLTTLGARGAEAA